MRYPLQAGVIGFQGDPTTIYAMFDTETGNLLVNNAVQLSHERFKDCTTITNDPKGLGSDCMMTDQDLVLATKHYMTMSSRISYSDKAARARPTGIEFDGFERSGSKYRVDTNIKNAEMAVMSLCWYVAECLNPGQDVVESFGLMDGYNDLEFYEL